VRIDFDGRLALVGGADGPLPAAVRQALVDNGAGIVAVDVTAGPDALDAAVAAQGEPFLLVLASKGADGLPDTDEGSAEFDDFTRTIRHLAPRLKRVVLLFSSAGLVPVKGLAAFSAGQAGLAALNRTLAMELGPAPVVNAVAVGAFEAGTGVRSARFLSHAGVRRPASLDEIVSAVLFLADPDNSYMTGHIINVDGGWAAGYARNF
jgi:NAD(P)-dependent dehydrogenase (short-subunit alcohol dehydrogenase family)